MIAVHDATLRERVKRRRVRYGRPSRRGALFGVSALLFLIAGGMKDR